jgi:asparagine synthase (glutamine-hydrolysing)
MMFRAPMDAWINAERGTGNAERKTAPWIDQVLSPESLKKAGYFDPAAVAAGREKLGRMRGGLGRTGLEMGLTAVVATQLWHHLWISGDLADLPSRRQETGNRSQEDPEPSLATGH